ncbi:DUF3313 domain-containing protein, partial [Salmonella enterica subsp. enterica serovar Infantis]
ALSNSSTPLAFDTLKQVVDDRAPDTSIFEVNKK